MAPILRGDVYLVSLAPTRGAEIRKTRPCVVVSPNELNAHLATVIVAPMTTGSHGYPFRVSCQFAGKSGHIVLDQIRAVDIDRLGRKLGSLTPSTLERTLGLLQDMFAN